MAITGIVSFKPLKSGKVAVMMEVEPTQETLIVLANMYGKEGVLNAKEERAMPNMLNAPEDRFFLLLDVRTKCQQIQDLITAELEPLTLNPNGLAQGGELTASELIDAKIAADEFERKDHIEFSKGIPENDFYGEKETEDAD